MTLTSEELGTLKALCKRVAAVLALCLLSCWEIGIKVSVSVSRLSVNINSDGTIFPSLSSFIVNEMFLSIEFNVSWKAETPSFVMMQKLSSTYLLQLLEGKDESLIADSSICFMGVPKTRSAEYGVRSVKKKN